ncbi:MAG: hypothetical protein GY941_18960 [Planctomycetes bacterium]|nr:hypothetical protein [Planctomycetota bacterium]
MRNFIILFNGREGTSPLVRLLNNFDQISIIHQVDNSGWEPFDRHNCGSMSLLNLEQCFDIIFNKESIDIKRLNHIYTRTSKKPLEEIRKNGVVGFKMRFSHLGSSPNISAYLPCNRLLTRLLKKYHAWSYKSMMLNLLKKNNVTVFFAIRQDVLRWGLSKYHGDGKGNAGHLQFKLASGNISREQIGKINVDCKRLEKIILNLEDSHTRKRQLMEEFKLAGIQAYPLCYEDFLADKRKYFREILEFLELEISTEEIDAALQRGEHFEKVHSDDISEFVVNHQEVLEKFGNRFISWR